VLRDNKNKKKKNEVIDLEKLKVTPRKNKKELELMCPFGISVTQTDISRFNGTTWINDC
jgi:hypothetical protein